MGRQIITEIDIAAPPASVWEVLVDLPGYGSWNPFIVDAAGVPVEGARLRLQMQLGARSVTVRPTVTERRDAAMLGWTGSVGVRGLFDAAHTHELVPTASGTRYVHCERFSGLLVPMLGRTLDATEAAFRAMNDALDVEVQRRRAADAERPA